MSMLMQLVVLMNMLTLMQDGDMQMLMLEESKEKGPGMLLQGGGGYFQTPLFKWTLRGL